MYANALNWDKTAESLSPGRTDDSLPKTSCPLECQVWRQCSSVSHPLRNTERNSELLRLFAQIRTARHWMPLGSSFVTTGGRYFCKSQLDTNVNRSGKKTFHSSRRSFNGYTLSPCRHTFSVQGTKRTSKQGCQNCTHSVSPCSQLFIQPINHQSFWTAALSTPGFLASSLVLHYIVLLLVV